MQSIQAWLKEAKGRPKSYVDAHRTEKNHGFRDRVFLWVKPRKSFINLVRGAKLSPQFERPFEISE